MAEYRLSNKAIEDLGDIWDYTFDTWSEEQADRYYHQLLDFCQTIADNPTIGKNYIEVVEGLKGFRVSRHIIFYRIVNETLVQVERILHERMDLKKRIQE